MRGDVRPSNASKPKNPSPILRNIWLTSDDYHRMAELYADGLTCRQIADKFGCSLSKVSQTLRKLGVKMRHSTRFSFVAISRAGGFTGCSPIRKSTAADCDLAVQFYNRLCRNGSRPVLAMPQ